MSLVRFASLCDVCDSRSPEYQGWLMCRECLLDICPDCMEPGSDDGESGRCLCRRCAVEREVRNG